MTDNFIPDRHWCLHFNNENYALEYLDKFGYECPRFEDDDSLVFDEAKFSYNNRNYTVRGISFEDNGDCIRIYCGNFPNYYSEYKEYKRGEKVKRPTLDVIDADGIKINVGDTLWYVGDDDHDVGMPFKVTVSKLRPDYYSNNGFEVVGTNGWMYKARTLSRRKNLLPCPFCGSNAEEKSENGFHYIRCSNPGCFAGAHWVTHVGKEELYKAWNTRH